MAEVACVDGLILCLLPLPCLGRDGVPYEVTLRLERAGRPFGEVGERCGFFLATLAKQLRGAREAEGSDGFPDGEGRDQELLSLRARDPDDVAADGELRLWLRDARTWVPGTGGARGRWARQRHAVLDVWGPSGTGVRAVLDSDGLLALLDAFAADCRAVGAG